MFPSQKRWAKNICDKFKTTDYCLFVAQMQSGKTGTYLGVARKMLKKSLITKVVVFSGNREKELRIQTENRISSDKHINNATTVVWGASLDKYVPTDEPTLYIWDESHFGQSKGQAVDRFLKRCNLTPGNKGQKGNYLLSVSATPFSELINLEGRDELDLVVWMDKDEDYWGVEKMIENQQIVSYRVGTTTSEFEAGIMPILKEYDSGFSLIRVYDDDYVNTITRIVGDTPHILYDSDFQLDIETILSQKPITHTLIILKGKLQMGKTIMNQQYINLCMETCRTKKTDSLLQGFIGRFCGYNTNHNTKIYIPDVIYDNGELTTYIGMFDGGVVPVRGMNLLTRSPTTKKELFYHE